MRIVDRRLKKIVVVSLLSAAPMMADGQSWAVSGQASGWTTANPDSPLRAQFGIRYLPELTADSHLSDDLTADADLSLNLYATHRVIHGGPAEQEANIKLHRASLRLTSDEFELRVGLQKINFGPAVILRSLMWFDKIDPRDPLQLTDGVYGLLGRYYFLDNTNIWLWGLLGNDNPKGWEYAPTKKRTIEYGGRAQIPFWTGEVGATFHHREADLTAFLTGACSAPVHSAPENRFAIDGKWNPGIGIWFEAALIHEQVDLPRMRYQRQWTLGADYTFEVGNGLTALIEYFRIDNPDTPLGPGAGRGLTALSINTPLNLFDKLSCLIYRDWQYHEWYRLITWQRTYDNWIIYLLAFWNPQQIRLNSTPLGNTPFDGAGIQVMVTFNH
jgi:hypothetical protein